MVGASLALNVAAAKPNPMPEINNKYYYGVEAEQRTIDSIIMHFTAGSTVEGAVDTLKKRRLSYHFIIDKDGTIYQLVNELQIAKHAKGVREDGQRYNNTSIGISLVNYGKIEKRDNKFYNQYGKEYTGEVFEDKTNQTFWQPYAEEQLKALYELGRDLQTRYNIVIDEKHIFGHEDTSNNRDPGPAFDWEEFYKELEK